ncbi:iron uptake system protein EfeO [Rosenbergiella australiborealis]|uniref:EfeM/EfeO family lipoprotein n=1 Tax=Rosenbergiella australiborealis TaxID=1544696 RepID=A0ABS5T7A6_9GAMM|nr:iron uptake system protein EfeO [Rosenbergiella australiborealis]MBT0728231.1 EfeM/EfeO family lipoprotein [Rosenbergiella australiborealis]
MMKMQKVRHHAMKLSTLAVLLLAANTVNAAPTTGVTQVNVTLVGDQGGQCQVDQKSVNAGPVTFNIVNKTATAITEIELLNNDRILGEKENLAPGLPAVKFTLNLDGGHYQIYCPGAAKELIDFTVTGQKNAHSTDSISALLKQGTDGYGRYVESTVAGMVTAVTALQTAIDAGQLEQAKIAYAQARPYYERIESDVDGFLLPGYKATDNAGNLDYLIDMRASNLDPAVGWHGFHAIERDLFEKGKIDKQTQQTAKGLVIHIAELNKQVKGLTYKPEDLANGAADLLEEVQNTKINGEEEAYSHIDLVDFAGNVEGAMQAFAYLQPGLEKIDPTLTQQVSEQFTAVRKLLDQYRDSQSLGGYRPYTSALKAENAAKLSRAIQALQEPLSHIAEKVATHAGA